jgi:hypothetical protein
MTVFQIYLFAVLIPSIGDAATIVFVVALVGCMMSFMICATDGFEDDGLKKVFIRLFYATAISMLIAIPLPSKEDSALMFAGAYASNLDGIKDLPPNAVKLLNQYMASAIKNTTTVKE